MTPKQKPECKCVECSTPLMVRRKRCELCILRLADERKHPNRRRLTVGMLGGGERELTVERPLVHRKTVFDVYRGPRLTAEDTCGVFVDILLGLLADRQSI
jgi:hypothetical protein